MICEIVALRDIVFYQEPIWAPGFTVSFSVEDDYQQNIYVREGTFFIGTGGGRIGRGILEIFFQKSRGLPTSQIGLMHDPS